MSTMVRCCLAAVVLSGLLAASGCEKEAAPKLGNLAPDFTLVSHEGKVIQLSELRGQVVFINFWATWCPPCRDEMPAIEAAYQKYKDSGVVFLGVDLRETWGTVLDFVDEGDYSWTFMIDDTGEVAMDYNVTTIPRSFFIDKKGIIRSIGSGSMSQMSIEARLDEMME